MDVVYSLPPLSAADFIQSVNMLITPQLLSRWISTTYHSNVGRALEEFKSAFAVSYKLAEDGRAVLLRFNPVTSNYTRSRTISSECANLHLSLEESDHYLLPISRSVGRLPVCADLDEIFSTNTDVTIASHKLDGISLVLYYYKDQWRVRSANSLIVDFDVSSLLAPSSTECLAGLDTSNSYTLELIDGASGNDRCRTCYPEDGLYYVTTLSNACCCLPQDSYEDGFQYLQRYIPTLKPIPRFSVSSKQQLVELLDSLPFNIQGLVVDRGYSSSRGNESSDDGDTPTDCTNITAACATASTKNYYLPSPLVPNPRYSLLHSKLHKDWLTYKDVLALLDILDVDSFIALFPNAIAQLNEIDKRKRHLFAVIYTAYEQINSDAGESQKDFATYASAYPFSQFLFNLRNRGLTPDCTWSRTPIHNRYDLLFSSYTEEGNYESDDSCICTCPSCKS